MPFLVQLTDDAVRDLEEICDYIGQHDAPGKADHVLKQIEQAFSSLAKHPRRGNYPKELLDIGIREYREIFFQALSHHLPGDGKQRLRAHDRRWTARHADVAAATLAASVNSFRTFKDNLTGLSLHQLQTAFHGLTAVVRMFKQPDAVRASYDDHRHF